MLTNYNYALFSPLEQVKGEGEGGGNFGQSRPLKEVFFSTRDRVVKHLTCKDNPCLSERLLPMRMWIRMLERWLYYA